jgi:hypothetical protein
LPIFQFSFVFPCCVLYLYPFPSPSNNYYYYFCLLVRVSMPLMLVDTYLQDCCVVGVVICDVGRLLLQVIVPFDLVIFCVTCIFISFVMLSYLYVLCRSIYFISFELFGIVYSFVGLNTVLTNLYYYVFISCHRAIRFRHIMLVFILYVHLCHLLPYYPPIFPIPPFTLHFASCVVLYILSQWTYYAFTPFMLS